MTSGQCKFLLLKNSNTMQFERVLLFSVASILYVSDLIAALVSTKVTSPDWRPKTRARDSSLYSDRLSSEEGLMTELSSPTTRRFLDGSVVEISPSIKSFSDVLGCLVKRYWDSKDGERIGCYDTFLSFWNTKEDSGDNEMRERKKSKKKQWDVETLMLGAGVKLILFLPILAVLTGKAISLSLTSLLITSLAFLYKTQMDSYVKRSDSKISLSNDYFLR